MSHFVFEDYLHFSILKTFERSKHSNRDLNIEWIECIFISSTISTHLVMPASSSKRNWRFEWWSLPTVAFVFYLFDLKYYSLTVGQYFLAIGVSEQSRINFVQSHGQCRYSPGYIWRKNIILQRVMRFVYSCTQQLFQLKRNQHSVSS